MAEKIMKGWVKVKRICKIKINKENRVEINYQQKSQSGGWNDFTMSCIEKGEPELYIALNGMNQDVIEMCEQPLGYIERVTVKGVSFSYGGEKEVMGATISASMKLEHSHCPLNINTPHKASESYNDGEADIKQLLSGECVDRLHALHKRAERYVDGVRAQGNLFEESTITFAARGESITVTPDQLETAVRLAEVREVLGN